MDAQIQPDLHGTVYPMQQAEKIAYINCIGRHTTSLYLIHNFIYFLLFRSVNERISLSFFRQNALSLKRSKTLNIFFAENDKCSIRFILHFIRHQLSENMLMAYKFFAFN
jgi:hypothetical protein